MMRSILATALLVAALTVSTVAVASGEPTDFSDVEGTTHEEAILAIVEEGVTVGYPDGTFRPTTSVTRGQLASFFERALDLPSGDPTGFSDVEGTTHEEAIGALVEAGITDGFPDGTFRPNVSVSRGQMATFVASGFDVPDDGTLRLRDIEGTTHDGAIRAVVGAGVVSGFPDGTFRPNEEVSRGQMATFLARAMGLIDLVTPPDELPEDDPGDEPEPGPAPSDFPLAPSGTTFGNGTHSDVAEGTYRAGATNGCYWARLSGFSGGLDDIIANEFTDASTIVTIDPSDAGFESTRCAVWEAVQDTYPSNAQSSFDDGAYVVGEHIQPGTYRTDGGDGCYWERLAGFSGELDDVITNGFTDDNVVVTISEGDVGFAATRCGNWTRD